MATTRETLREMRAVRIRVLAQTTATERALAARWGSAWAEVAAEWRLLVDEIIEQAVDGEWPSRWKLARMERATNALRVSQEALDAMIAKAQLDITGDLRRLVDEADEITRALVGTQLPEDWSEWTHVSRSATNSIVERATKQVTARTWPLSRQAAEAMKSSLIRGVQLGENPRVVARTMVRRVQGSFNGGLYRARNIARTEMLDAFRQSSMMSRVANADVVSGWMWAADFSERTCPACIAKDGTVYPADWPGPEGHPSCRCDALPVTRSWRDLGFDMDEPDDAPRPTARDWFDQQDEETQRAMLGRDRYDALRSGRMTWDDMAVLTHNDGWRDSWTVAPAPTR